MNKKDKILWLISGLILVTWLIVAVRICLNDSHRGCKKLPVVWFVGTNKQPMLFSSWTIMAQSNDTSWAYEFKGGDTIIVPPFVGK